MENLISGPFKNIVVILLFTSDCTNAYDSNKFSLNPFGKINID